MCVLQYAVVLTLLVICEIISGIAAAVKRDDVSNFKTEENVKKAVPKMDSVDHFTL